MAKSVDVELYLLARDRVSDKATTMSDDVVWCCRSTPLSPPAGRDESVGTELSRLAWLYDTLAGTREGGGRESAGSCRVRSSWHQCR